MKEQVAVVGLGAAGSMALWRLAKRGVPVVGFERFGIGHGRGSSHGETRMGRIVGDQPLPYRPLSHRAEELWAELSQVSGRELFVNTTGLAIGARDGDYFPRVQRVAVEQGLDHEILDANALRARFPMHSVGDDDLAVLDRNAGYLKSELGIWTAVEAAEAAGARVVTGIDVAFGGDDASGVTLLIGGEPQRFRKVVVAVGAWIGQELPELAIPFEPVRINASWFRPATAGDTYLLSEEKFPIFMRELGSGQIGWGFPQVSNRGTKIGLHGKYGLDVTDATANDAPVREEETARIRAFVADGFHRMDPNPSYLAPCMVNWLPDERFAVGIPDSHPALVVLAACSGHGFKYAPATGELGAQLALDEETFAELSAFNPDRFAYDGGQPMRSSTTAKPLDQQGKE